jgi:hypothetical protein
MDKPAIVTNPSFTGTLGGMLTLVPGSFSGSIVAQTDDWLVDYIPISGTTIDSSQYPGRTIKPRSTAINDGGRTIALGSDGLVPGVAGTVVLTSNFNGYASGTQLSTLGFNVYNDATVGSLYQVVNNAAKFNSPSAPANSTWLGVDTTSVFHVAEVALGITPTISGARVMFPVISGVDQNNFVSLGVSTWGGGVGALAVLYLIKRVGGTLYADANYGCVMIPSPAAGAVIRLELKNGQIAFYLDGVQYSFGPNSGGIRPGYATRALGTSSASQPTAAALNAAPGTKAGLIANGLNALGDSFTAYNTSQPFDLFTATDSVSFPTASDGRLINVSGAYQGAAPSGIDLGVVDDNSEILVPRTTVLYPVIAGGIWSAQIASNALMGASVDAKILHVQAWRTGDDNALGRGEAFASSVYATIPDYGPGMNVNAQYYSKPSDEISDIAKKFSYKNGFNGLTLVPPYRIGTTGAPADANANCNMDYDGIVHSFNTSEIDAALPQFFTTGRYGPSNVFRLSGIPTTINVTVLNTYTVVDGSGTESGYKYLDFHFAYNDGAQAHGLAYPILRFTGSMPAGGDGLNKFFSCRLRDSDDGHFLTPGTWDLYGNHCRVVRFMQGAQGPISGGPTIGGGITSSMIWHGGAAQAGFSTEDQVAWCNDANIDLWFNIPDQATDDWVTANAAYIRDNLNPGRKVYIEYSNERWNSKPPYWMEYSRCVIAGLQRGWDNPNATPSTTSTRPTIINGLDGTITSSTSTCTTLNALSVGTLIFDNFYNSATGFPQGWSLIQINTAIGVNGAISTANASVVSNGSACNLAGSRYGMTREKEIFGLFDTVFGASARSRTVRIHADWFAQDVGTLADTLAWDNGYKVTDKVCVAPYWDNFNNGRSLLGTYTSTNTPGWTTSEHALYKTNVAQWINAFLTGTIDGRGDIGSGPAAKAVDSTLAVTAAQKHGVEAALRAAHVDYVPNAIGLISYECGFGVKFDNSSVLVGTWTGTGNGKLAAQTPYVSPSAPVGNWSVQITAASPGGGSFQVLRPDSSVDGTGTVGTAYDGGIKFLLSDGSVDFAVGDTIQVTVPASYIQPYLGSAVWRLTNDARFRAVVARFYSSLRELIGDVHVAFCDYETNTSSGTQVGCFGHLDFPDDTASPRYLGWLDASI